jgi:maltose alpha-D-glucosyltransferase/alpha-amylase
VDQVGAAEKFEISAMSEWVNETGSWLLMTIDVTLVSAAVHRFGIPLALAWEDEDEARVNALLHATLAKVRRRERVGVLFDAFWDDRFCCAVVTAMKRGETLALGEEKLVFSATSAYPGSDCPAESGTIVRDVSERGRLRVNIDDQLVLKGYRWMMEGMHPELELSRFLTETAKFAHIPQLAGTVEYVTQQGQRSSLAILERYTQNQGDAWRYTLDYLERFLDVCSTGPEPSPEGRHAAFIALMKTLGQRTAEFHQALALPDDNGAFGCEPVSAEDVLDWVNCVRHEMRLMFERLEQTLPQLPDATWPLASSLLAMRPKLYRRIVRAANVRLNAVKTRCHGNYHLGQVWLVKNDLLIANYGGAPGISWAERRRKHMPLRDVAGMLFSLSQAGAAALDRVACDSAEAGMALQPLVDDWEGLSRKSFLRSYRRAMSGHPSQPAETAVADAMITLFLAERAIADVGDLLDRRSASIGAALRRLVQVAQR